MISPGTLYRQLLALSYNSEHPADPVRWTDYVAESLCYTMIVVALGLIVSTVVFSLQKRIDILLKSPLGQILMYTGAGLHIFCTCIGYLPIPYLQSSAVQACVLYDYWLTLGGVMLWCIGNSISLTNNVLGCVEIVDKQMQERNSHFPSYLQAAPDQDCSVVYDRSRPDIEELPGEPVDAEDYTDVDGAKYKRVMLGDIEAVVDLDGKYTKPGRWTIDALIFSRGEMLLRRLGCAWNCSLSSLRKPKSVATKAIFLTCGLIVGYVLIFVLLCSLAQIQEASKPVKVTTAHVELCISRLDFKFSMALGMCSYVALSWVQLLFLRRESVVPRFCSREYLNMLAMLTAMFVVTLLVNILGMTRYYWGRFIYVLLVLALYAVTFYCMSGRVWKDVFGMQRRSDKQIMWQLSEFSIPRTFRDMFSNEMQCEFLYRDFSNWMVKHAPPAFVPTMLRLGSPDSRLEEAWERAEILPLHGSTIGTTSSHYLVFPRQLILLFEAVAYNLRKESGEVLLPLHLTQSHAMGLAQDDYSRLAQEANASASKSWVTRMTARLGRLFSRLSSKGATPGDEDADDLPPRFRSEIIDRTDVIWKHFLHTNMNYEQQERTMRKIVQYPNDQELLDSHMKALPTLSCDQPWFREHLTDAHSHENSVFFREVYAFMVHLFDHYYFPQFMKHERVERKMTEISETNQALAKALKEEEPFSGEHDEGLSKGDDYEPPLHLHAKIGYLPPRRRHRPPTPPSPAGNLDSLELARPGSTDGGEASSSTGARVLPNPPPMDTEMINEIFNKQILEVEMHGGLVDLPLEAAHYV